MRISRTQLLEGMENVYIFFALFLVTQACAPLILAGDSSDQALSESNPATLISALVIYLIAIGLLLRKPRDTVRVIAENPLLVIVFVLPLLSSFWSISPDVSARRAMALLMTGLFCVYIATRLSPDEFLRRLLLVLFAGGVASLAYTVVSPGTAIEHSLINTGSWKGVYGHKAILGRIAAVAVMVSIYVKPRFRWERIMRWATIAIFLFLSIKSQSRASWLMMIASLGIVLILSAVRTPRLSRGLKIGIGTALAAIIAIGALGTFDQLVALVGRDETFSGRVTLWNGAITTAMRTHPLLGAGYRAFWTETGASAVRTYIANWGGLPAQGHNGYLDIWLELGVVGLAVFAAFALVTCYRLAKRVLQEPREPAWAAMSVFFFIFLLNNASVTVAFKHTDIAWIFAALALLYAHGSATASQPVRPFSHAATRLRTRPAVARSSPA